jgi:mono/diheme cytochrome c family protein
MTNPTPQPRLLWTHQTGSRFDILSPDFYTLCIQCERTQPRKLNCGSVSKNLPVSQQPTIWIMRTATSNGRTSELPVKHITLFVCAVVAFIGSGCERAEPLTWQPSAAVAELDAELQSQIIEHLQQYCGTALNPSLLGAKNDDPIFQRHLAHGQAVYMKRCYQCHGVSGDGNGPMARYLYPRPRDYRPGVFKFTTTPYGDKPRRDDLHRTIKRGIRGTSMPSFARLPKKDVDAVIDYVMVLTHRGEFERQMAFEAEAEEELDPEYVPDLADEVLTNWKIAERSKTNPLTPQPELTQANFELGRKAFLTKGCSKCHGEDGRGHTKDNIGKDAWGYATRAADLTSGMLRGGAEPSQLYQRIQSGINGTPMPGFENALKEEPETIWNLVSYVLEVSGRRRRGETISAGLMRPYDTGSSQHESNDAGE